MGKKREGNGSWGRERDLEEGKIVLREEKGKGRVREGNVVKERKGEGCTKGREY